jgi:hypothetical protein
MEIFRKVEQDKKAIDPDRRRAAGGVAGGRVAEEARELAVLRIGDSYVKMSFPPRIECLHTRSLPSTSS